MNSPVEKTVGGGCTQKRLVSNSATRTNQGGYLVANYLPMFCLLFFFPSGNSNVFRLFVEFEVRSIRYPSSSTWVRILKHIYGAL